MQRAKKQKSAVLTATALIAVLVLSAAAAASIAACSRPAFAAEPDAAAKTEAETVTESKAETEKHPLPALSKSVSADRRTWADACTAEAGQTVRYRLIATMSDTVVADERAVYTVFDKPAPEISIDADSVTARIVDTQGAIKARLSPAVSREDGLTVIALGDLKKAYADLTADDRAVIEYAAIVAENAQPGTHENVAFMGYDLGRGEAETVGVMAAVTVPAHATPSIGKSLPGTGDPLSGGPLFAAAVSAIALAVCALAAHRHRRE